MRVTQILAAAALALASSFAVAAANDAEQAIRKSLQSLESEIPVDSIAASPVNGLYEVKLKGGRVLYASADGQFLVQGYLFQIQDGKPVNLTEKAERVAIAKTINAIPASEMVVYPAKGETKSHITVFTDTTCPYCHKLHAEVPELNKRGIEVRYVAFPRQGLGSSGDQQLQAVWCSTDRKAAMDKMVDGKEIKAAKCENPVSKQFQMGQSIGVNGTPAIVLEDGQVIPGYQPAPQVAKLALTASK
ncbi:MULTISPECIES: bifunctional protein-disulfide isomerase/oxidoreductase DsbC [Pseudomonas]|jgi:thiol:disulfide interchange protein DsbC|uniref:Thiol:disulfide interchange protein n=2 Tax=Pseudomonas TaxID=286 RepID=A0A9X8HI57_PSEPU|nr:MULTISPECIES: bifunctional protein-disulfide isomerase/oxidoreductase DsbC [Pseudomonas]KIU47413.1 protein-disulfide isomerase [Pseudomonas putida]MBG8558533.1 bifunctional protein-disulfide isomerase/oxidoreductase DsbC [Pseudomonas qingdaonensis]MCO7505334.1 bifunctional protein-disulfide isomerase/oxidoreductase DsbC [Pseudomonas sp. VE 267-6A]MCO7528798.1 bifunctional protein-disulfide isomerase/oxidoreductase DsbC [Pseudomonas sp. 2]MCQ0166338.1 bifunctional protein-disulfide isomerase